LKARSIWDRINGIPTCEDVARRLSARRTDETFHDLAKRVSKEFVLA